VTDEAASLADRVLARARKRRRPPTYREFSKTTVLPAGPLKGHPYDPDSDPCQAYLIDQMDSGNWERLYVCTPPQIGGKTTCAVLVPALRNAVSLRLPVGYGLPTLGDLDKAFAEKIKPAITGSGYGSHLPKSGPGARGGRGHTLGFQDPETGEAEGMLVFLAGGAYGSTVAAAIVDEVDQFRTADGEPLWGALEDIFSRADAYGRKALRIAVGTIENDDRSIIIPLVTEHGTGTRPWWPCVHCNRYQLWTWGQVNYEPTDEETARRTARLACVHCGGLHDDGQRLVGVRRAKFVHRGQTVDESGEIVGTAPRTTSLGLLWTALDSVRGNLGELCVDHLRAKTQLEARNDHGLMRKFVRYRLCQPYTGDKISDDGTPQQISKTYLAARSEASTFHVEERSKEKDGDGYWVAQCPSEVEAIVAACDVQRGGVNAPGRLYFLLTGFDSSFRTWDLSWGSLVLAPIGTAPNTAQLHAGLDRLHDLWNSLTSERFGKPLIRRGVDVGDRQDEIRQWLTRRPEWWPVKGESHGMKADDKGFDAPGWLYRRPQEGRWYLYHVDVNQARRQAQMQFLVPVGKPGAAHLPKGLNRQDSLVSHYCATAEIPDGRGGTRWSEREIDRKHHADWARRHDLLDCRTYALALAYQWLRDADRRRAADDYRKKISEKPTQGRDWLGEVGGGGPWL
jgi:hypothetical protein